MNTTENRPPVEKTKQSVFRHLMSLMSGVFFLVAVASDFGTRTQTPFLWTLLIVIVSAAVLMAIIAALGVRAFRDRSEGRQFQLSSLFLVIVYLSIFLASFRWLVDREFDASRTPIDWIEIGVMGLVFFFLTTVMLVMFSRSLIWLAVSVIRSSWVQRVLGR